MCQVRYKWISGRAIIARVETDVLIDIIFYSLTVHHTVLFSILLMANISTNPVVQMFKYDNIMWRFNKSLFFYVCMPDYGLEL